MDKLSGSVSVALADKALQRAVSSCRVGDAQNAERALNTAILHLRMLSERCIARLCENCTFPLPTGSTRSRRFCSHACWLASYRQRLRELRRESYQRNRKSILRAKKLERETNNTILRALRAEGIIDDDLVPVTPKKLGLDHNVYRRQYRETHRERINFLRRTARDRPAQRKGAKPKNDLLVRRKAAIDAFYDLVNGDL